MTLIATACHHCQPVSMCLAFLFFVGAPFSAQSQQELTQVGPGGTSSRNRIEIFSATRERIRGQFTKGDIGVAFDSHKQGTSAFVEVKTLQGRELVSIRERGSDIVASVNGGQVRAEIKKAALLELRQPLFSEKVKKLEHGPVPELRTQLRAVTKVLGEPKAVQNVKRTPEYALLPSLSWELGKLGLTGHRYSPSVALHAIGSGAGKALRVDPRTSGFVYRPKLPPGVQADVPKSVDEWLVKVTGIGARDCWNPSSGAPNLEELPKCPGQCKAKPNKGNDCLGMCGPGCDDCWEWICGDCCFHNFCAVHDTALRSCDGDNPTDVVFCVMAIVPWYLIVTGCS